MLFAFPLRVAKTNRSTWRGTLLKANPDDTWFWTSQRLRELIFFAHTFGGESFGWDLNEIADLDTSEYAVHCWVHGADDSTRMAGTFWEFIQICLDKESYSKILNIKYRECDDDSCGPRKIYRRITLPEK